MQITDQPRSDPDRCHLPGTETEIAGTDRQDVVSDRHLGNTIETQPRHDVKRENEKRKSQ
jgi:hypothetical protein